jgi:tRNA nucleotidyltransferase (CCA-adding enzyme)
MFKELNHKTFSVGGSIRNEFLGREAKDLDFVIEDTSEAELLAIFPEAKKVGDSFPVYLIHGHEVALARTEQSTGDAYTDFEFVAGKGVLIHHDLGRRDITINMMARNYATGALVDPHNGQADLEARIIRTINPTAFEDDALRIYRAVRFAVEFDFNIEDATFELMKASKEKLKSMTMERVIIELEKVYDRADAPSQFFKILLEMGALQIHFKPLYVMSKISSGPNKFHNGKTAFEHAMDSFDYAKAHGYSFDVALAGLFHDTGKGVSKKVAEGETQHHYSHEIMSYAINKKFVDQHRFTAKQADMIVTFARNHMYFHMLEKVKTPVKLVRFFKKIRKHVDEYIQAANTDHELSAEKLVILENLKRTFKETVIDIPKSVHDKGKEAVKSFVENAYVVKYKEISK